MLLCAGVTPPAMLRRANRDVDWAGMWEVGHGKWDGLTGYIRDVCLAHCVLAADARFTARGFICYTVPRLHTI